MFYFSLIVCEYLIFDTFGCCYLGQKLPYFATNTIQSMKSLLSTPLYLSFDYVSAVLVQLLDVKISVDLNKVNNIEIRCAAEIDQVKALETVVVEVDWLDSGIVIHQQKYMPIEQKYAIIPRKSWKLGQTVSNYIFFSTQFILVYFYKHTPNICESNLFPLFT
jgi:hypothetical protein